jgi:hypothetical protein
MSDKQSRKKNPKEQPELFLIAQHENSKIDEGIPSP